jgi:signal transduction histidine kinase
MAADALEVRIAHLEGAYEQIDRRLRSIEGDVRELRGDLRNSIASLRSELLARMDHQFFWVLGLLIASILVPIAVRLFDH